MKYSNAAKKHAQSVLRGKVETSKKNGEVGKVCERWRVWGKSWENMLDDLGEPPSKNHELVRIDPLGDWCKENCEWITRSERVKRTPRKPHNDEKQPWRPSYLKIEYEGKKYYLGELYHYLKEIGLLGKDSYGNFISKQTVYQRLYKNKTSKAFTESCTPNDPDAYSKEYFTGK